MTLQAFSASNSASCAFYITFVLIQLNIFECNYGLNVHRVILRQFNSAFYSVAVWLRVSVCELLSNLERKKQNFLGENKFYYLWMLFFSETFWILLWVSSWNSCDCDNSYVVAIFGIVFSFVSTTFVMFIIKLTCNVGPLSALDKSRQSLDGRWQLSFSLGYLSQLL